MVITDLEAVESDISDPVQALIVEVKQDLENGIWGLDNNIDEVKKTQDLHSKDLKALAENFDEVKKSLSALDAYLKKNIGTEEEVEDEDEEY